MSKYQIAETKTFLKQKVKIDKKLYKKIKDFVYPQLRENPYYGVNIKRLKGSLKDYYRYRVGNYRLFYLIEEDRLIVAVVNFKHRQHAYE